MTAVTCEHFQLISNRLQAVYPHVTQVQHTNYLPGILRHEALHMYIFVNLNMSCTVFQHKQPTYVHTVQLTDKVMCTHESLASYSQATHKILQGYPQVLTSIKL